jgi:hypothetical protein
VGVADDTGIDFSADAGARLGAPRRSAYLLCGGWHRAEEPAGPGPAAVHPPLTIAPLTSLVNDPRLAHYPPD